MNANGIALAQNDVVFGKTGRYKPTPATTRCREIMNQHFEAHGNADKPERRKIENSILEHVKKDLPSDARFLRYVHERGSENRVSYRFMTDHEVQEAIAAAFQNRRAQQKFKAKRAVEMSITTSPQSHDPPSQRHSNNENVVFLKARNTPVANAAPRLAQEIDLSGEHNNYSAAQPINELFLNAHQRLSCLRAIQSPQTNAARHEHHSHLCTIVNTTPTKERTTTTTTKRPIGTTTVESHQKARRVSLADTPKNASKRGIIATTKEKPIETSEELATLRKSNRNKQATIDLLVCENCKMKETIVGLEREVLALQHLLRAQEIHRQSRLQFLVRILATPNSIFPPLHFPRY